MSIVNSIIESKETSAMRFQPKPEFYKAIEINKKRFGKLRRGEIEPTITELQRIAVYFELDFKTYLPNFEK